MSAVTYRHENNHSFKKKGVKHTIREKLTDGEFLTLSFLRKIGDAEKDFYKLTVKETSKDKFSVREKKGATESPEKVLSLKDFIAMLKKDKDLAFAVNYLTKERGTYKAKYLASLSKKTLKGGSDVDSVEHILNELEGGAKKKSKKASKKSSKKKASKKSSKKKSKKSSKNRLIRMRRGGAGELEGGAKKKSKKASKKSSKKKSSKKKSKKAYKCHHMGGSDLTGDAKKGSKKN